MIVDSGISGIRICTDCGTCGPLGTLVHSDRCVETRFAAIMDSMPMKEGKLEYDGTPTPNPAQEHADQVAYMTEPEERRTASEIIRRNEEYVRRHIADARKALNELEAALD